MSRAHGTYVKYVQDRCRCEPCRQANRDYERERSRRTAPPYVDAAEARAHIVELGEMGVGLKQIAKVSGLPHGGLSKLMHGSKGRAPSKRIRPETAEKILAVTPADAADGAPVDAAASWAILEELFGAGVPRSEVSRRIGQNGRALQLSRTTIHARHVRAIAEMGREYRAGRFTYQRVTRWGSRTVRVPGPDGTIAEPVVDVAATDRAIAAADRRRSRAAAAGADPVLIAAVHDDTDQVVLELAQVLEARIDRGPWRDRSACLGQPGWLFFPSPADTETVNAAKKICASCPVKAQCLDANINEDDGVYGGTSERERRQLRRARRRSVA